MGSYSPVSVTLYPQSVNYGDGDRNLLQLEPNASWTPQPALEADL
jgi:hypothetical protein